MMSYTIFGSYLAIFILYNVSWLFSVQLCIMCGLGLWA